MEAAAALPDDERGASAEASAGTAEEEGGSNGKSFFRFSDFEKQPEKLVVEQVTKKRRVDDAGSGPLAWNAELPAWFTEGAAVTVRKEQNVGVDEVGAIVSITGSVASVRIISSDGSAGGMAGSGLGKERSLPTSMLIPVAPQVGASVKVVSGNKSGCFGTLVGLAGTNGVVQIGSLNYDTLPLNQLVVLASWR